MQLDLYSTPAAHGELQSLSQFLTQRKVFITIDDATEYKRCRVQSNRKGVVLRDLAKGATINTKKQQLCRPGDFLVAEIDAKVGGYGFVPVELEGAIVSSHYYLFEVDETRLIPAYLHYLTQSDIIQNQISSQGSTNYAAIRPKEFLAIEIPYVEVDQQRNIVSRLDALTLEATEFNQESAHQATLLTRLRQAILREAVQGRLLPQDPTDEPAPALLAHIRTEKQHLIKEKKLRAEKPLLPLSEVEVPYEVPQGWVWCRALEVLSTVVGHAFKSQDFTKEGIRLLRNINVSPGFVNWNEVARVPIEFQKRFASYQLELGDIILGLDRPIISTGLKVARISLADLPSLLLQRVAKFSPVLICADYLYLWFNSPLVVNTLDPGRSKGVPHISHKDVEKIAFPLPPLAEQQRIVGKVAELLAYCTELEVELSQARTAASALHAAALREAFTVLVEAMAKVEL